MKISNYFTQKSFGVFGAGSSAALGLVTSAVMLSSGSAPGMVLGAAMLTFTAGQLNLWQQEATGKPIWQPKAGKFGFGL